MGALIVCYETTAKEPYVINSIGKKIFSIEELCFYVWQYAHLLEEEYIEKELVEWIGSQLEMKELSNELERIPKEKGNMKDAAVIILRFAKYLSEEELVQYEKDLKMMGKLTGFQRNLRKADDLVKNRKYYRAVIEYKKLLKDEEAKSEENQVRIYHNLGVAYSKMFFFRHGAECFLKAFLMAPSKESLRQYKLASRFSAEEIEEDELIREFPSSASMDVQIQEEIEKIMEKKPGKMQDMEELHKLKDAGKVAKYYDKMEEILHIWQSECREYMNTR